MFLKSIWYRFQKLIRHIRTLYHKYHNKKKIIITNLLFKFLHYFWGFIGKKKTKLLLFHLTFINFHFHGDTGEVYKE